MKTLSRPGLLLIFLLLAVVGCQSGPGRTLQTELTLYKVKPGESIQTIAWRYGLTAEKIVEWNQLKKPGTVFPGQLIRLSPPPGYQHKYSEDSRKLAKSSFPTQQNNGQPPQQKQTSGAVRIPPPPPVTTYPAPGNQRYSAPPAPANGTASGNNRPSSQLNWIWPTDGKVVGSYSGQSTGQNGIVIAGVEGQGIYAAEAGTVVYSGSGLRGYKEMIIIQHPGNYLTAYAYNRKRYVTENESVTRGQKIAEMGKDDNNRSVLLFEIRHNGKPVNPMTYLPKS